MDILSRDASTAVATDVLRLAAVPSSSEMDELRETARNNGKNSLYYFTTAILGWNKVRVDPHKALCEFIQKIPMRRKVLLIPRDCYKSTVGSKSFPLWILVQDDFCGLPGLEHRILMLSSSAVNSQKQIGSIQTQIETNEMLRWLYPEIIPDITRTTWTNNALLFPRQGAYGENTIECGGVDTHLVSRHYTVQIKDDLEDQQSMEQPSMRLRVKNFYKAAEALFVDERMAFDLLIGTRWGIDDLYSDIQKNESDTYEFHTRPLRWTQQDLKEDFRIAEETSEPPVYNMDPAVHAPDPEKTYLFFPELFPEESIARIEAKQGSFMFSMLYLNNPRDPALAEFKEKDFRFFTFDQENNLLVQNEDASYRRVEFSSLKRVLFWDPALTEREQKKRSRNAMVCVGFDEDGMYVLDAWADFKNPTSLYDRYIGMHQRYQVHTAGVEDAGFQRILKYPLYDRMDQKNYSFPIVGYPPIGDKDARIRSLLPYCESHRLYVRKGLQDLVGELRGFPVFPTKDLADALAATLSMRGNIKSHQGSKAHKKHLALVSRNLATRSAVTGY
jgi:predicted phage terminase large subunit-like protein